MFIIIWSYCHSAVFSLLYTYCLNVLLYYWFLRERGQVLIHNPWFLLRLNLVQDISDVFNPHSECAITKPESIFVFPVNSISDWFVCGYSIKCTASCPWIIGKTPTDNSSGVCLQYVIMTGFMNRIVINMWLKGHFLEE